MKRRKKTKKISVAALRDSSREGAACESGRIQGCSPTKFVIAGLVVVFFGLMVVFNVVEWNQSETARKNIRYETRIKALEQQVKILKKKGSGASSSTADAPKKIQLNGISETFEEAVNEKDFATVESLLAPKLYYIIDSSDCCGDISKEEAADNLRNYIRAAKSFDFDQEQQVVRQMKVNLAETFSQYTIGIADNKMVLSYRLNKSGQVNSIILSASHQMYDLE